MNEDWKKKYDFDEKTKVFESSMPTMPCNVSPFVKREDYNEDKYCTKKNKTGESSKKASSKCVIA